MHIKYIYKFKKSYEINYILQSLFLELSYSAWVQNDQQTYLYTEQHLKVYIFKNVGVAQALSP